MSAPLSLHVMSRAIIGVSRLSAMMLGAADRRFKAAVREMTLLARRHIFLVLLLKITLFYITYAEMPRHLHDAFACLGASRRVDLPRRRLLQHCR